MSTETTETTETTEVLVRFEIAALGHAWHDEVRVTRTPLVDNLIAGGRLTVLEDADGTPTEAATPATVEAGPVSWFATPPEG